MLSYYNQKNLDRKLQVEHSMMDKFIHASDGQLERLLVEVNNELARRQNEEYAKRDAARQRRRDYENSSEYIKKKADEDAKMKRWIVENLKPGDFVKFKGTRDRGFRMIKSIEFRQNELDSIVCEQFELVYQGEAKNGKPFYKLVPDNRITTHGWDKLTHLVRDAEGRVTPIKNLIK